MAVDLPGGGPAYPLSVPGVRLKLQPAPEFSLMAAMFSGDPTGNGGANSLSTQQPSGTLISFDGGILLMAEAGYAADQHDRRRAQLYASGFLPEVWIPDEPTQALRRQVTRRNQIVRQRSRLKNIIQSILHAHLIPSCPHADLCGARGRTWLSEQVVPEDERLAIDRRLREFDRLGEDLRVIERDLARSHRLRRAQAIDIVDEHSRMRPSWNPNCH